MRRWITFLCAAGFIAAASVPEDSMAGNNGNKGHNQVTVNITRNIVVGNGSGNIQGKGRDDRNHIPIAVAAHRQGVAPIAAKKKS